MGLSAVAALISGVIAARVLGPQFRGELAALVAWVTVLVAAGEMGVGFALSYAAGHAERTISELWTQSLLLAGAIGLILAAAALAAVPLLLVEHSTGFFTRTVAFGVIALMIGTNYQTYLLLGLRQMRDANSVTLTTGLVYTAGCLVCAVAGWHRVGAFVGAFWAANAAGLLVGIALVAKRAAPKWVVSLETAWFLVRRGFKSQIAQLGARISQRLDQVVLAAAVPAEALGYYAVAVAVTNAINPLFQAGAQLVIPHVHEHADVSGRSREVIRFAKLSALAGALAVGIGILLAPWILPYVFGEAFAGAVLPSQVLLVAVLFQGSKTVLGNGLRTMGHPGDTAVAEVFCVVVLLMLFAVLIPLYGILGAATAVLAANASATLLSLVRLASASGVPLGRLLATPLGIRELLGYAQKR